MLFKNIYYNLGWVMFLIEKSSLFTPHVMAEYLGSKRSYFYHNSPGALVVLITQPWVYYYNPWCLPPTTPLEAGRGPAAVDKDNGCGTPHS